MANYQDTSMEGSVYAGSSPMGGGGGFYNSQAGEVPIETNQQSQTSTSTTSDLNTSGSGSAGVEDAANFQTAVNQMSTKMATNNKLIDARNKLYKHMYHQPLSDEEKASLTPELQHTISTDNRNMIDNAIKGLTDQLGGYEKTINTNLGLYSTAWQQVQDQKQKILDNVISMQEKGLPSGEINSMVSIGSGGALNLGDYGYTPTINMSNPKATTLNAMNNPGALKYVGQPGATQGAPAEDGGYLAKFDSPEAGYQALEAQIQLDASKGKTVSQYVSNYAPPGSNNTAAYIQQLCSALGVTPDTPLSKCNLQQVAEFQANKESGASVEWTAPGGDNQNSQAQQLETNIKNGQITLENVLSNSSIPQNVKQEVSDAIGKDKTLTPQQKSKILSLATNPNSIKEIKGSALPTWLGGTPSTYSYISSFSTDGTVGATGTAATREEAQQKQNAAAQLALGFDVNTSITAGGNTYNVGDTFSFTNDNGVKVKGTVNEDGTVSGDDGNTYDKDGNIINK